MGIFDIFILFAHTRANSGIQRIPNMADGYIVYTSYTIVAPDWPLSRVGVRAKVSCIQMTWPYNVVSQISRQG